MPSEIVGKHLGAFVGPIPFIRERIARRVKKNLCVFFDNIVIESGPDFMQFAQDPSHVQTFYESGSLPRDENFLFSVEIARMDGIPDVANGSGGALLLEFLDDGIEHEFCAFILFVGTVYLDNYRLLFHRLSREFLTVFFSFII
jgi:hypothetical protein